MSRRLLQNLREELCHIRCRLEGRKDITGRWEVCPETDKITCRILKKRYCKICCCIDKLLRDMTNN